MIRKHRASRKPPVANSLEVAIARVAKIPAHIRMPIQEQACKCITLLITGQDCRARLGDIADCLNVAEELSNLSICSDEESRLRVSNAQEVVFELHQRHERTGSWAMRAQEIHALREGIWLFRTQLDHCSNGEYETAMRRVIEKVRQALAGNASPGAQVVHVAAQKESA
jgi:hypothetical protein